MEMTFVEDAETNGLAARLWLAFDADQSRMMPM
jgi:hypothetical protein